MSQMSGVIAPCRTVLTTITRTAAFQPFPHTQITYRRCHTAACAFFVSISSFPPRNVKQAFLAAKRSSLSFVLAHATTQLILSAAADIILKFSRAPRRSRVTYLRSDQLRGARRCGWPPNSVQRARIAHYSLYYLRLPIVAVYAQPP